MGNQAARLNELVKERDQLAKSLAGLKHILRGSIMKHGNICGKPVCVCVTVQLYKNPSDRRHCEPANALVAGEASMKKDVNAF